MSEWISVEDRLPSALADKVLVAGGDLEIVCTGIYTPNYGFAAFECDIMEDEMGQEAEVVDVTHWMPLPPKP